MYNVSNAFKDAMNRPAQQTRLRGTINDDKSFFDKNVLKGSFTMSNQCAAESEVKIGQVYIGEMNVTFLNNLGLEKYSVKGSVVKPFFGLKLANGEFEDIPLGVFTVSEAKWTRIGVTIKAYDNMSKFQRSFSSQSLVGTPFELATLACTHCGLSLATTEREFSRFVNGQMVLQLFESNDIETWRDLMSWIAQTVGCNVFANRAGEIIFRSYEQEVTDEIPAKRRFEGAQFSDYETRYTGISCVNIEEQTTSYYGDDVQDDALTYNLGSNPFLQVGVNVDRDTLRRNVLLAIEKIRYVPFVVESISNMVYDLMDVVRFTGGYADDTKLSCIMKYDFKYGESYKMEGIGKDPTSSSGNSKSDKNIAGLMGQIDEINQSINKLLNDYNTGRIVIGQQEQAVGMITFYVEQTTDIDAHFMMDFYTTEPTHIIWRFYDAGIEELFSPIEEDLKEGYHQVGFPHSYLERMTGMHSVYVTCQCLNGEVIINPRDAYFTINAGTFAKAIDDITSDLCDLTMRQLLSSNGPDQIWTIGIATDDNLIIAKRTYSKDRAVFSEWETVYAPGKAMTGSIEFDGQWELLGKEKYTLITEDQPYYFWVDLERNLICQHGEDESSRFLMAEDIIFVHSCRGYSSMLYPEQDQGLVVVYVTVDGEVFYTQYAYDITLERKTWTQPVQLKSNEVWEEARVYRLNDYRLSFLLTNSTHNIWLITERTFVGQSAYPENIKIGFAKDQDDYIPFLQVYPSDYVPPEIHVLETGQEEFTETIITVTKETHYFEYDYIRKVKGRDLGTVENVQEQYGRPRNNKVGSFLMIDGERVYVKKFKIEIEDSQTYDRYKMYAILDSELFASEGYLSELDRIQFDNSIDRGKVVRLDWIRDEENHQTRIEIILSEQPTIARTEGTIVLSPYWRHWDGQYISWWAGPIFTMIWDLINHIVIGVKEQTRSILVSDYSFDYLGMRKLITNQKELSRNIQNTSNSLNYYDVNFDSDSQKEDGRSISISSYSFGYYDTEHAPV